MPDVSFIDRPTPRLSPFRGRARLAEGDMTPDCTRGQDCSDCGFPLKTAGMTGERLARMTGGGLPGMTGRACRNDGKEAVGLCPSSREKPFCLMVLISTSSASLSPIRKGPPLRHAQQKSLFRHARQKIPLPSCPTKDPPLSFPTLVIGNPESSLPDVSFIDRPTPRLSPFRGRARLAEGDMTPDCTRGQDCSDCGFPLKTAGMTGRRLAGMTGRGLPE